MKPNIKQSITKQIKHKIKEIKEIKPQQNSPSN